jgi:cytochrome b
MIDGAARQWVRVRIWDAPVRLVHWLMVFLLGVSWWTANAGKLDYHRYSGYGLLGLVVFRIYWGFAGSSTARFANFIRGPAAIRAYVAQLGSRMAAHMPATPGHNPLGALSVVALLALVAAQIVLGLFAVDVDGIESGPLSAYVSFDVGRLCARLHGRNFNVLLAFAALHVAAVLFYLFYRRENLIAAMLNGRRLLPANVAPPVSAISLTRMLMGAALAGLVVWGVARA